jgi:hypothetical protein
MLHLGEAQHEVRRDVEIVHRDHQTQLNQIVLRVPGVIAKQTPETSEQPFDLRLTAAHPQQDESHLSNGKERNTLTVKDRTQRSLSHSELSRRLPQWKSNTVR